MDGDGDSINGKTIQAHSQQSHSVKAKTGHHGEWDIDLIDSATATLIATLNINSIKDPQDGSGLAGTSQTIDLQSAALGHRSSPGDADLRRIEVTLLDMCIGRLRYNEDSLKASHNGYQRDETLGEQIAWTPATSMASKPMRRPRRNRSYAAPPKTPTRVLQILTRSFSTSTSPIPIAISG